VVATADSLAAGYRTLTEACGLLDRSERGKLALTGPEAKTFLQGQVTNDVEGLEPGRGCYAAFLTHKGKMLGDLRILDRGDELLLDTERVSLQELFNMIRRYKLGADVELHKRTLETGLLSLIGPEARTVAGAGALGANEHDNVRAEIAGHAVVLVATDVGVDVLSPADATDAVRAALEAAGAERVAEEAAEALRVEHGRPRYGIDLDDGVIPQEAGLNERAVSFTKGCYVGQETVARLFYRGKPNRGLRGLRLSAPAATGDVVRLGEKEVGRLGSVAVSPAHGPIALAILRRQAEVGDTVAVGTAGPAGEAGGRITAVVADLPFEA
jgi:folate-binding protein YgfZ